MLELSKHLWNVTFAPLGFRLLIYNTITKVQALGWKLLYHDSSTWGCFCCVEDPPLSWNYSGKGFVGCNSWFGNCNMENLNLGLDLEWCSRSEESLKFSYSSWSSYE